LRLHKGRIEVGIAAFSQTDLTYDLMKITVLVPVMHGDDDLSPRCCRAVVSEANKERDAKDLQGLPARHAYHASALDRRRSVGFHQKLARAGFSAVLGVAVWGSTLQAGQLRFIRFLDAPHGI
jgi:hypothetical protein